MGISDGAPTRPCGQLITLVASINVITSINKLGSDEAIVQVCDEESTIRLMQIGHAQKGVEGTGAPES